MGWFSSVQFSLSVVSNSVQPHDLQHARVPCPSPASRVCSSSCPLSWWCHSTISSSVAPFCSYPQSFPASGFFQWVGSHMKCPKYWHFNFSISLSSEYSGFWIDLFELLEVQETLKSLLLHHNLKASILWHTAFFMVQLSPPYTTTGKTITLTRWTFVNNVMQCFCKQQSSILYVYLLQVPKVGSGFFSQIWMKWARSSKCFQKKDHQKWQLGYFSCILS